MSEETEIQLLEMQARLCRALSDPKRLRIVYALTDREMAVGELAEQVGAAMANVSQHLNVLRACGLVRSRREGTSILYSLAYPEIAEACKVLRAVLTRQIAEGGRLSRSVGTGASSISDT
jgi:DNA-binding transcriptional ArsR family regulator